MFLPLINSPRFPRRERPGDEPVRRLSDAAYLGEGATLAPPPAMALSPANLLARHVVRDGETILLVLKPSRWFVVLSSIRFTAGIIVVLCALHLSRMPTANLRYYADAGVFAIALRVMWAILNWMGRLYLLTDQRILRFAGVFTMEVAECPLRKVARTKMVRPAAERLLRLGTIETSPLDEQCSSIAWQMINRPRLVQEQIELAIRRAKQGCGKER